MVKDIFRVAQWEFAKGIKNKGFLFLTFVFPIIMVIIFAIISFAMIRSSGGQDLYLAIVDETSFIRGMLEDSFVQYEYGADFISASALDEIEKVLQEEKYDGILHIPEDVIETNQVYYYFKDLSSLETDFIRGILSDILVNQRLVERGYSPLEIKELTADVRLISRHVMEADDEEFSFGILLPFFLALLMIMAVFFSGSILLQGIIKEKNNRIVEIILSSVPAKALMFGKIIAYALLSIVQILIWVLAGSLIISYFDLKMLEILYSFKSLLIVLYVFFAFLLVASLNAIVGASMKDAQSGSQTAGFLILIPLIPIYFTSSILQNPNGTISKVLSYIPFFSPTTMMLRLGVSTPPGREIILTLAILLVFSYLLILLSAKLFRIGMLMYGKNVNLRELIKWARSKDY